MCIAKLCVLTLPCAVFVTNPNIRSQRLPVDLSGFCSWLEALHSIASSSLSQNTAAGGGMDSSLSLLSGTFGHPVERFQNKFSEGRFCISSVGKEGDLPF